MTRDNLINVATKRGNQLVLSVISSSSSNSSIGIIDVCEAKERQAEQERERASEPKETSQSANWVSFEGEPAAARLRSCLRLRLRFPSLFSHRPLAAGGAQRSIDGVWLLLAALSVS